MAYHVTSTNNVWLLYQPYTFQCLASKLATFRSECTKKGQRKPKPRPDFRCGFRCADNVTLIVCNNRNAKSAMCIPLLQRQVRASFIVSYVKAFQLRSTLHHSKYDPSKTAEIPFPTVLYSHVVISHSSITTTWEDSQGVGLCASLRIQTSKG